MTIRNDATRLRIPVRERRPLRGVVARQGQVLLDTDVNEAERTLVDRVEAADAAMLGPPDRLLYPAGTQAFAVGGTGANATIDAGTAYLNGWQLVNAAKVDLLTQPNPWKGAVPTGPAAVVLKALVRYIDPVEDAALADVALGDAQASGRALNDWQAFLFAVPAGTGCAGLTDLAGWKALVAPSTGTLAFQIPAPAPSSDPCSLTPAGGHSRFENLLYRIEVHGGVPQAGAPGADGPRFGRTGLKLKLSRRNASLLARVTQVNGTEITVAPPALDPLAWFAQGGFAEIIGAGDDLDPTAALAGERLFKVLLATDEVITLSGPAAAIAGTGVKSDGSWFLRFWDTWPTGEAVATVSSGSGPIDLGDGIAIKLGAPAGGFFRRGDYWTAAVRADGSIAWPGIATATPEQQPPHGPEIRYAPLAVIGASALDDCRIPFATLSDRALLYRGGDGQEAFAPQASAPTLVGLPHNLRVAVMRGATPVAGATVRWRMPAGAPPSWIGGSDLSAAPVDSTTGPDGLVEVTWSINAAQQGVAHAVEVVLLDKGQPATTPAVQFGANFAAAARTSFKPGTCPTLSKATDVQTALDALCAALDDRDPETIRLRQITLLSDKEKATQLIEDKLILNGLDIPHLALAGGIRFAFDGAKLALGFQHYDPIAEIALDLPYPTSDADAAFWRNVIDGEKEETQLGWFGFHTLRLDGLIRQIKEDTLEWTPSRFAVNFLRTAHRHHFGYIVRRAGGDQLPVDRVLCRIRLRSALIFGDSVKTGKRIWLNAEHLGTREKRTGRELLLDTRDGQRAADLDMFVYLTLPEPGIVFYYPKGAAAPNRSNLGTVEDAVLAVLEHNRQPAPILLTAHAEEPGTDVVNLKLSERRAEQVKALLVQRGVAAALVATNAQGNQNLPHPKTDPDAEESLNRRVEVSFVGKP
jgi:hypothetical protein